MKSDPDNLERLKRIATVLQQQAVPMSRINECITKCVPSRGSVRGGGRG